MKIMFFTLSLFGGGAERVTAVLANEMSKKNQVSLMTVYRSKDSYSVSKKVKRLYLDKNFYKKEEALKNKIKKLSLIRILRIAKSIRIEKPDVVITLLPLPSIYIMMARLFGRRVRKTPIIISERCDPSREYSNSIVAFFVKKTVQKSRWFCISD